MGVGVHPSSLVSIRGTPPAKLRTVRNPKKAMQATSWQVFADCREVISAACEFVVRVATRAARERGVFRVVLSGGGTPQLFYRAIAQGLGAFALVGLEPRQRALVFIPFLLFNVLYAYWVLRRARAMRLV